MPIFGCLPPVIPVAEGRANIAHQQDEQQPQQELPRRHLSGQETSYAVRINNEGQCQPKWKAEQREWGNFTQVTHQPPALHLRWQLPPLLWLLSHSSLRRTASLRQQWVEKGRWRRQLFELLEGMETDYLPEFQGAYLEDSYFLGLAVDGCDFRLKMLFALTVDHPSYEPPKTGEQHCYREGSILVQRPTAINVKPTIKPTILADPDGSLDLGSLELYQRGPNRFHVETEWFEITFATEQVSLQLA